VAANPGEDGQRRKDGKRQRLQGSGRMLAHLLGVMGEGIWHGRGRACPTARWAVDRQQRWHGQRAAASAPPACGCWQATAISAKEGERLRCWACVGTRTQLPVRIGRAVHQAGVPLVSMPPWLALTGLGWRAG